LDLIESQLTPIIIDNNLPHQGIVKRKKASSEIACLVPDVGGSGV
jgi:hypothetical protein